MCRARDLGVVRRWNYILCKLKLACCYIVRNFGAWLGNGARKGRARGIVCLAGCAWPWLLEGTLGHDGESVVVVTVFGRKILLSSSKAGGRLVCPETFTFLKIRAVCFVGKTTGRVIILILANSGGSDFYFAQGKRAQALSDFKRTISFFVANRIA